MTPKRFREKPDLRRPRKTRNERSKILIVTEGVVTEVQYFKELCRHLRATGTNVLGVNVKGAGRDPVHVVSKASNESKNGTMIGTEAGFDAVWCVFDVDDHERIETAVELARKLGFDLAVSNPCFEVWLLWHFEECEQYLSGDQVREKLKKHGIAEKNMPANFKYGNVDKARERVKHKSGDIPSNPGSRVWVLSEYLRTGKRDHS